MEIVTGLIIWISLSVLAGVIAGNKGRSGAGFFFLSVLLSPLIGIIAAAAAKPNQERVEEQQRLSGEYKKCPSCAETIKTEAAICKHCQADVSKITRQNK